jgi:hypothetical protein
VSTGGFGRGCACAAPVKDPTTPRVTASKHGQPEPDLASRGGKFIGSS